MPEQLRLRGARAHTLPAAHLTANGVQTGVPSAARDGDPRGGAAIILGGDGGVGG